MTRRYGNKPRTRDAKKRAVFMRLVEGRGKPVTLDELVDAGYLREDAYLLLASVMQGGLL